MTRDSRTSSRRKDDISALVAAFNHIEGPLKGIVPLIVDSPYGGGGRLNAGDMVIDPFTGDALSDPHINKFLANLGGLGVTLLASDLTRYTSDVDRDFSLMSLKGLSSFSQVKSIEAQAFAAAAGSDPYTNNGNGYFWLRSLIEGNAELYSPYNVPSHEVIQKRHDGHFGSYHESLEKLITENLDRSRISYNVSIQPFSRDEAIMLGSDPDNIPAFAIHDNFGASSDEAFTARMIKALHDKGYGDIRVNEIFPAGEIIKSHGNPGMRAHSLQLKINQELYRDPNTLGLGSQHRLLARHLQGIFADMAAYARAQIHRPDTVETLDAGRARIEAERIKQANSGPKLVQ